MSWMVLACGILCITYGGGSGADGRLGPIDTLDLSGGPQVILRAQPTATLAAVRLSVPTAGSPAASIEARLHRELVRARLEPALATLGAELHASTGPTHTVYTLTSPAEVFDEVTHALRQALDEPRPSPRILRTAQIAVYKRTTAELEMPSQLIRNGLRRALFTTAAILEGVTATEAVGAPAVRSFWRRTHRPERVSVVVVGPLDRDAVVAAFRDWPGPRSDDEPGPDAEPAFATPSPEVILSWAGIGYTVNESDPATLAVAAELVAEHLPALGVQNPAAELWWTHGQQALVIIGSTYADSDSPAQTLRDAVAEAGHDVDADQIAAIRRDLEARLRFAARTPQGLAEVLGDFMDRTGRADGALRFLDGLNEVTTGMVVSSLESLLAHSPEVIEIRP